MRWVIEPTRRIVAALKLRFPEAPIIGFPRGAGLLYQRYRGETGVDAFGLDTSVPLGFASGRLQPQGPVQGNLDPVLLVAGGVRSKHAVRGLRHRSAAGRWVFNLGHGVLPETPPENVAALAGLLARACRLTLKWRGSPSF